MQMYAKPQRVSTLRVKNKIELYLKLNPRQKWKVTLFKDDNNFVGIERDNVAIILDKTTFKEYFSITL